MSDSQKNRKNSVILNNIKYILFYALSLSVALGFNDLVITIFKLPCALNYSLPSSRQGIIQIDRGFFA